MGNKSRRIGLILLLLVIAAVGVYLLLTSGPETVRLRGYVGGEKIGLLEDEDSTRARPSRRPGLRQGRFAGHGH